MNYPFVIIWSNKILEERFFENSYSSVQNLEELDEIIDSYFNKFIHEYQYEIRNEINNYGSITINKFYQMVNCDPNNDSLFLSLIYFDIDDEWKKYNIKEDELNSYFMSYINYVN